MLEAFLQILLIANLSLNQTLLTFSVWDKPGWLNLFWQFLCERLSSFNPKGFYYAWSCSLCGRRTFFCTGRISRKLCILLLMFSTGFTALSVLLFSLYQSSSLSLCTVFGFISSNMMRFSWSTHLLICLWRLQRLSPL